MSDEGKNRPHFWIPDEEVIYKENKPTGRDKPRDVVPSEHGSKLTSSLEHIVSYYKSISEEQNSLAEEDIVVFKVTLPEGEKIANTQRQKILKDNGLQLNAVKNYRNAIVSTTKQQFMRLKNRVDRYKTSGQYATFQYIDDFSPLMGSDKKSDKLKRLYATEVKPPENIDIQMLLVPNLENNLYTRILPKIKTMIIASKGQLVEEPYYLSDGTPVVRALLPSQALENIINDEAIYRVEETRFFSAIGDDDADFFNSTVRLNMEIDVDSLPVVVVLDSGITFPEQFNNLIVSRWVPDNTNLTDNLHGTKVASKVIFSNLGMQLSTGLLTPRARVIDALVLDGVVAENVLIKRIQQAVSNFKEISKIFNISANSQSPIEGDEISIIGYELDNLMHIHGVQFVISAGNHNVWMTANNLEDVIDDDDSKIAAPADSMLGITVGAAVEFEHADSMSRRYDIAPYSRKGPGLAGFRKPDVVAYGATVCLENGGPKVLIDNNSFVLCPDGQFLHEAGTSFTAPVISGDLAEIASQLPGNDVLLAKALLYHGAQPLWDDESMNNDDADFIGDLYGRGISSPDLSKFSSPSRVTFVRIGELNRLTKERVKFYMPTLLAAQPGRNIAKVTISCVSRPPIDRTKGTEYLGAYISASLHKVGSDGKLPSVNPSIKEGRKKWDSCYHFNRPFTKFEAGDWQVWLELHTRWDIANDVKIPYALAITIEDVSGTLDIYNEILNETQGRFMPVTSIKLSVKA